MADDALHYPASLLVHSLHFLIVIYELHAEGAECDEMAKFTVHSDAFAYILFSLESVAAVLGNVCL